MRFFSRSSAKTSQPALTATPSDLIRIGTLAFAGQDPHTPGLSALPITELDGYAIAALASAGYPASGSPEWQALQGRFLDELTAAAERAGDWGFVGALCIATNVVASDHENDPRYLAIVDRAANVLRLDGVAYPAVPPFVIKYWQHVYGWEDARPAGWPSALDYVPVPALGDEPPVGDLEPGESRRLAQPHEAAHSNVIYAERRADGTIVAVIDGVDTADGVRKRWEWQGLERPDYRAFLRELGDRLVTPSYWAHDDLYPYFPCRGKSRAAMRLEAKAATVS